MGIYNLDGFICKNNLEKFELIGTIKVTYKEYILRYEKLNIHFTHRLLGKICDNTIKMSINKMEFE